MAIIKMDVSEYETLKENAKLLQTSLDREKELQSQIQKLNQEKIKALEDAKMQVVHITKTEHTEYLLYKKEPADVIKNLLNFLKINGNHYSISTLADHTVPKIQETFFDKAKTVSFPNEEYTTKGLDDVKAEIRIQLNKELSEDIKQKLQSAELNQAKYSEVVNKVKTLENELTKKQKSIDSLDASFTDLTEKLEESKKYTSTLQNYEQKIEEIKKLVNKKYSFFEKFKVLEELKSYFK